MSEVEIFVTEDGSHSLRNNQLQETYHSAHGALRESLHVFIENGLAQVKLSTIRVLEVGFGTGLNALLTLEFALRSQLRVYYTALEPDPLPIAMVTQLNYPDLAPFNGSRELFFGLHAAPWDTEFEVSPSFWLKKEKTSLQEWMPAESTFDMVFYDAFAPSKQPGMWAVPCIEKVCKTIKPAGFFVTYCAKGQLKRDLRALGMEVQTLAGPPGKKEMVRAVKT